MDGILHFMGKSITHILLIFFAAVLFSGVAFADFELRSLRVSLTLNPDGTAHATEEARLFMSGAQSISLYEESIIFNDLSSWTTRTGISDLRTHISRAYVDIVDLRVRPQPVDGCNNVAETCYANLILDYDIYPISSGTPGILKAHTYKPRTTQHSLRSEAFSFVRSKTDDIILPKGYSIEISVPENARAISFSRVPDNVAADSSLFRFDSQRGGNLYLGSHRKFIWANQTLSQFSLSYELEQSLEGEISTFFGSLQSKIFSLFFSESGLAYAICAATLLISAIWLHSIEIK